MILDKNRFSLDKYNLQQNSQFIQATNIIQKQILSRYLADNISNESEISNNSNYLFSPTNQSNQTLKKKFHVTKISMIPMTSDEQDHYQQQFDNSIKQQNMYSPKHKQINQDNKYYLKGCHKNNLQQKRSGSNIFINSQSNSIDKQTQNTKTQNMSKEIQKTQITQKSQKVLTQISSGQKIEENISDSSDIYKDGEEKQISYMRQTMQKNKPIHNNISSNQTIKLNDYKNYLREIIYNQQNFDSTNNKMSSLNDFIQSHSLRLKETPNIQNNQQMKGIKNTVQLKPLNFLKDKQQIYIKINDDNKDDDNFKSRSFSNTFVKTSSKNSLKVCIKDSQDNYQENQMNSTENKKQVTDWTKEKQGLINEVQKNPQLSLKHQLSNQINQTNQLQQLPLIKNQKICISPSQNKDILFDNGNIFFSQNRQTMNSFKESAQLYKNRLKNFLSNKNSCDLQTSPKQTNCNVTQIQNQTNPIIIQQIDNIKEEKKQQKQQDEIQEQSPQSRSEQFLKNIKSKNYLQNKLQTFRQQPQQQQDQSNKIQFLITQERKFLSPKHRNNKNYEDNELQPWSSNPQSDYFESSQNEDLSSSQQKFDIIDENY